MQRAIINAPALPPALALPRHCHVCCIAPPLPLTSALTKWNSSLRHSSARTSPILKRRQDSTLPPHSSPLHWDTASAADVGG
jgi:hypothetical protein